MDSDLVGSEKEELGYGIEGKDWNLLREKGRGREKEEICEGVKSLPF